MTSPSRLVPVAPPVAVPTGVALAAPSELEAAAQDLEAKRERARAWLASRGIMQQKALYGAAPDA